MRNMANTVGRELHDFGVKCAMHSLNDGWHNVCIFIIVDNLNHISDTQLGVSTTVFQRRHGI